MKYSVKDHYRDNYWVDMTGKKSYEEEVNARYDDFIRRKDGAVEDVLRLLGSSCYFSIYNRLKEADLASMSNVDEVIQNTRVVFLDGYKKDENQEKRQANPQEKSADEKSAVGEEILEAGVDEVIQGANQEILWMNFGGKCCVSKEQFYRYLCGIVKNQTKNFIRKARSYREMSDEVIQGKTNNDGDGQDKPGETPDKPNNPEDEVVSKENHEIAERILQNYIFALQESNRKPHQLITYCYAFVLPQLFKKTCNKELLRKVDILSARKSLPPNSHYNEQENRLEGEIARKSRILNKWGYEAMYGKKVCFLKGEFEELYAMEKIGGAPFVWGENFQNNLKLKYEDVLESDLVITDEFTYEHIENWPIRIMTTILKDTDKLVSNEDLGNKKASELVEEMYFMRRKGGRFEVDPDRVSESGTTQGPRSRQKGGIIR